METLKFYEGGYNPEKEYVLYKSLEDGKFKLEYYRVLTTTSSTNHTHTNKDVLDKITDEKILYWDGKSEFDGDYESLINKPNIPSKTSDLTNDSDFVTTTEMNTAIANAQIGGGTEIDTSNFATKDELNAKVDKKTGYSLMADSEITRLSTVDNYDDTGIKNSLSNKSDINHTHSYNNLTDKPSIPSIDGLATETFVTNKIAEAQLSQGEIDLTGYATKDDLKIKADKTELHEHSNKTVLDGITSNKIASWDNKSNFSGNYNDLTNKPTLHSHSNKNTLDTITDEKIEEWNSKSEFSGDYNDLDNKPTIPTVDVNKSYVDTALSKKVDKKIGYSLVSDSEIERLANVDNYDDTEIKNELSKKANSSDLHSHSNKTVLDGITANKVSEWNNKSTFSGNYNDLTNKPTIPKVDSVLSSTSTNAIQNKVVKTALDDKSDTGHKHSYSELTDKPTIPTMPTIDSALSSTSTNPIQNKVVKSALDGKANSSHSHIISDVTNLQTSLDGKSNVGHTHSYNDLSDTPIIPTVTNDLTNALKSNYDTAYIHSQSAHAPSNAEQNVQSDWNVTDTTSDAFIKNKPSIHNHNNKNVLDGITADKVNEWNNKSDFSGDYNDLSNPPKIPIIDSALSTTSTNAIQNKVVTSALNGKANSSHKHSINDITNLQNSLNSKSNTGHTHDYSELENPPTIPTVDVNKNYVDTQLNKKVDKKTGYSLIADSEIQRLANVDNYDDSEIRSTLNSKANKTDLHSHSNKTVLDGITATKVQEWNNKSNFSGKYEDLENPPIIPTVDSALSTTSTNAIQNKVVTNALNNKANSSHTHSYKDLSDKPTIPTMPTIDSALSSTSTNPVQNKVVKSALDGKANSSHTHPISNITNLQTTLDNKSNTNHTHNYAGSSSAGGSASSAVKLATSRKISLNGDASGSANFDGTSDITINTSVRKYCMVGSDVENSNGWYKVASETMSGYGDTNITFVVTSTYGNYHSGILQLQIRSDKTNISCKTLVWFNRCGFSTDNFIVNINNMTWTLYANQTIARYGRLMFEVISESSITTKTTRVTLFNSSTKESTTPVATVKSKDGGKVNNALTTDKLATSRTLTIGKTGKTFDGSANVSWSLDEIGASASSHTHAISNVTNLQTALDRKSNTGHTHSYSELTNPPTIPVVDSALSSTSTNAIQNKVVKSALDNKSNTGHKHAISEITNLQTTLNGKSNSNHTHNYAGSSSAGGDATNALACSGNATTATKLQTARTINGTSFDGSTNITTRNWGTARNITIGNTTKSINGSTNISWTLEEIGTSGVTEVSTVAELKSALVKGGTIHIKGGEYVLGKNEELEYYSNTKLIGIGEVVIKVNPASASYIALKPHLDGTETGYTGVHNVTIENITMDGQGGTNNYGLFATAHCKNIDIKNCTFKNYCGRWHLVEINSSQNVKMTNCDITDYNYNLDSTDMFCTEAVQLDFAGDQGNYPFTCNLDNTGCQNITFESCNFKRIKTSWTAAVGSHTITEAYMPTNVTFTRCTFEDIDNCIYAPDFKNLVCDTCTIINAASFVIMHPSSRQNRSSCKIDNCDYSGWSRSKTISYMNNTPEGRFFFQLAPENELSASKITNNTILGAYSHAIGISPNAATITGNSVKYSGKHGIYLYGGSQTTITGNSAVGNGTLEGYTGYDIYISVGSLGYIKRCNISNNASYVNTDGNTYESTRIADNL